ncbi:MAG: Transcriptional regulator, GntR family [Actinomycetia bacterium]|nr:Transcriptional regulator, GntR family [Actinomycetes bacterium]
MLGTMRSDSADSAVDVVRRQVVELIGSGTLKPGQRLGGERELAVELGVSRSTLRNALGLLEQTGAVRRVPGRGGGTFVGNAKVERDLSKVMGVPALLREQGFTAGSRVVGVGIVNSDNVTAAALELKQGELVVEIVRIRLADGSPISLEHARFPAVMFPGLPELPLGGSLYELLESRYGVTAAEAIERIEAVAAGPDEAEVLDIEPKSPLLSITRTTKDPAGVPFEFSHDLFRSDRTRILVRTPGAEGAAHSAREKGRLVDLQPPG